MADLKTRVSVTVISHEGGAVAGSLADELKVTPCSFDAIVSRAGVGKTYSRAAEGTGAGESIDLRAAGLATAFAVYVANLATTGEVAVTLWADGQQYVLPVKAGGVAVLAAKSGHYTLAATGPTLTVNADEGVAYQVAVAGAGES